ncbi:MAG: MAPEG family protein [Myxococcota bacterium]|nr:MAPEG family protein [Myxococcota bacterium]
MLVWIVAVLAVFVAQTLLAPSMRHFSGGRGLAENVRFALGPRDEQGAPSPLASRAQRALTNMHEALPVFITLALLHVIRATPGALPELGAAVFTIARVLYVPAYLSGIPGVRSLCWATGAAALGVMAVALF